MNSKQEQDVPCNATDALGVERKREIDFDTLNSLSLKTENNLIDYAIVCVDGQLKMNDCQQLLIDLRKISKENIYDFDNMDQYLNFLQTNENHQIFVIISGVLGEMHRDLLVSMSQVQYIYVFCLDSLKHGEWANEIQKVRGVFDNKTDLLTCLHDDIKVFANRWGFMDEHSFQKAWHVSGRLYHLLMKILIVLPQAPNAWDLMLQECRSFYRQHPGMLQKIDDYEKNYHPDQAINYYSQDNFLYRIINCALRTRNIDIIGKFQPYISDLYKQLNKCYQDSMRTHMKKNSWKPIQVVYRGQYMKETELEQLSGCCRSRNSYVFLNAFGSTSLDPEIAMGFIECNRPGWIRCLFEIIIMYDYYKINILRSSQQFVDITSFTVIQNEKEVLFNVGSLFQLKHIAKLTAQGDWILIVLELVFDMTGFDPNWSPLMARINREKDDVKIKAFEFLRKYMKNDNNINWSKWWDLLQKRYGTRSMEYESLDVIMYECVGDQESNTKAIELHKRSLANDDRFKTLADDDRFRFVLNEIRVSRPTKMVALYEYFLQNPDTFVNHHQSDYHTIIETFLKVGDAYAELHVSKEEALKCYRKALELTTYHSNDQMSNRLKKKIAELERQETLQTSGCSSKIKEKRHSTVEHNTCSYDMKFSYMSEYGIEHDEWRIFWDFDGASRKKNSKKQPKSRFQYLPLYLKEREKWMDSCDLRVLLDEDTPEKRPISLSSDICSHFLLAIHSYLHKDVKNTGKQILNTWRRKKFMLEWRSLNGAKRMLEPHQQRDPTIPPILLILDRLIEKLGFCVVCYSVMISGLHEHNTDNFSAQVNQSDDRILSDPSRNHSGPRQNLSDPRRNQSVPRQNLSDPRQNLSESHRISMTSDRFLLDFVKGLIEEI